MKLLKYLLLCTIIIGFSLYGCSTTGAVSGDRSVTYEKDYNTMVETVEQAIRGTALEVNFAQESDERDRYTIVFNARGQYDNQSVQQDEGEVIVEKIEKNKTRIIINNPEYHFSVPDHQRRKYDRALKERIDEMLGV